METLYVEIQLTEAQAERLKSFLEECIDGTDIKKSIIDSPNHLSFLQNIVNYVLDDSEYLSSDNQDLADIIIGQCEIYS